MEEYTIEQLNEFRAKKYITSKGLKHLLKQKAKQRNIKLLRYKTYKIGAIKRNLVWEITFEQFIYYWEKPCYYCGNEIENNIGIDRINNLIGYSKNNCVPCCKTCNWMKRTMSEYNFINHCKQIYEKNT